MEKLIEEELLTEEECNSVDFGENNEYIDYEKLYNGRFNLLKKAYKRSNPEDEGFKKFVEENGFWIEDYAMFMAIKAEHNGESFELWEDEIRVRKPKARKDIGKSLRMKFFSINLFSLSFMSNGLN